MRSERGGVFVIWREEWATAFLEGLVNSAVQDAFLVYNTSDTYSLP